MEYVCVIWDPVTQKNIRELEMVQRRAARFVTGDYRTTSSVTVTTAVGNLFHRRIADGKKRLLVTLYPRVR
jgi:hypothetical protein